MSYFEPRLQPGSLSYASAVCFATCLLLFNLHHIFSGTKFCFYIRAQGMCTGCVYKVCFSNRCHVPCTLVLTACVYVWLSWRCRYIDSGANTDVRNTRDKGLSTCEMLSSDKSSEKARQPLLLIIPKCTGSMTEEQIIRNRFNVVCAL